MCESDFPEQKTHEPAPQGVSPAGIVAAVAIIVLFVALGIMLAQSGSNARNRSMNQRQRHLRLHHRQSVARLEGFRQKLLHAMGSIPRPRP
jgi:hypothetical protein